MNKIYCLLTVAFALTATACKPKQACNATHYRVASDENEGSAVSKVAEQATLIHRPSEYFLTLTVGQGNDAQEVQLVFDSGSSNLIMWDKTACKNDPGCKEKTSYDAKKSKTSQSTGRAFPLTYGSATAQVEEVTDDVGLLCGFQAQTEIGVIKSGKNVPNIVGAAYDPIVQPKGEDSFFDHYFKEVGEDEIFGVLFCGPKRGSEIKLGGRIDELQGDKRQFHWTPVTHKTYYVVRVLSAKIEGEEESLGEFPAAGSDGIQNATILDTGATFSRIPPEMLDKILTKLKDVAQAKSIPLPAGFFNVGGLGKPVTAEMPLDHVRAFPTIEFELIGGKTQAEALADKKEILNGGTDQTPITIKLRPEEYFKVMGSGKVHAKRAFSFRAGTNLLILGQPFFEGHYVEIIRNDDQGNAYIGFASNDDLCG
ncbi:MAG: pepsin-like aspartic protease [Myxococcota bacterium]